MLKSTAFLLVIVSIAGGAIGAAQQAKPIPSVKGLGACYVVTKAEIEQAMGTGLGNGVPQLTVEANICTYENSKGNKVEIVISHSQGKRDFSNLVDEARKALPNAKVQDFPGLGEKALLVDYPNGGTSLSVYRGGDALVVSVYGIANAAKAHAAVEKIARKALDRGWPAGRASVIRSNPTV